jgi:hypothetical protein
MAEKTRNAGARTREAAEAARGSKTSGVAEVTLGRDTYTRNDEGATMVQIAPHSYLSAAHIAIASGHSRAA